MYFYVLQCQETVLFLSRLKWPLILWLYSLQVEFFKNIKKKTKKKLVGFEIQYNHTSFSQGSRNAESLVTVYIICI